MRIGRILIGYFLYFCSLGHYMLNAKIQHDSLFNDKFSWTLADVHGQIKFQKYAQGILLFITK